MHPPPRLIYWELTTQCNLRCVPCRALSQVCPSPDELSTAAGISLIESLADGGDSLIVFTGGEPLLRPDLFVLARQALRCGVRTALATNGTLVRREKAKQVLDAGFQRVSISLDGPDAETHDGFRRVSGAFEAAVEGFLHLKELGMPMQVNTTVTLHNRGRLGEIHELVRKLGTDAWHLFLLVPVGCGLEIEPTVQLAPRDYEEVLYWIDNLARTEPIEIRATCAPHAQRIRLQRQAIAGAEVEVKVKAQPASPVRRGCLAGSGICFISHRGEVFPCGYLPVQAGDLRTDSFGTIWNTSPVLAELREPDLLMGKCGECEYRIVCGGCRARAFGKTGIYLYEEPFCNYFPANRDS